MSSTEIDLNLLSELLLKYFEFVREKSELFDTSVLTSVTYERVNVRSFDRAINSITFYYDYDNIGQFEKYEWDSSVYMNYLDDLLSSPIPIKIGQYLKQFAPQSHLDSNQLAHYILNEFTRYIIQDIVNKQYSEGHTAMLADFLLNDIKLIFNDQTDMREWSISLRLANFFLRKDTLSIKSDYNFTLLQKEDFEFEEIKVSHRPFSEKMFGKSYNYTTKLEFTTTVAKDSSKGLYPDSIKDRIDVELNILRLFRVVSVYHVFESIIPNSVIERGIELERELPSEISSSGKVSHQDKGVFQIAIDDNDILLLQEFRGRMFSLVSKIDSENYLNGSYIEIAFHRYLDALLKSEVYAFRILSAISCLEALLSLNEPEVGFKLRARLSLLLSCLGLKGKDISRCMKSAYNVRSSIVHGNNLKLSDLEFAREFCKEIVNYARLTIIIFMQMQNEYSKDKFLTLLDGALIDKEEFDLLKRRIDELVIPI